MELYAARVNDAVEIAAGVEYAALVRAIAEYALRAALARAGDQSTWEQERIRREGLAAVDFCKDGKAVWTDPKLFALERDEARRDGTEAEFLAANELDPGLPERLDADLRRWWRRNGYETPSLREGMRELFGELESDLGDRVEHAREQFIVELLEG